MRAESVNGVAEVTTSAGGGAQVTIIPASASGTATIEVKPITGPGFEVAYYEADGSPVEGISLASQVTLSVSGNLTAVRVTSTNTADSFAISVFP